MKNKLLIIAAILFIVIVLWFIFFANYPIIFVNSKSISLADFNKNYNTSMTYYEKALKTYKQDEKILEADEIKKELKRATLDSLIENILIEKTLRQELSKNNLNGLVDKKIEEIIENQNIQKAAETFYGFSFEEFREKVLVPLANKEILKSRVFLSGGNFEEKLKEMKSKAKVMIFLPGFEWDGNGVIIK